MRHAWTTQVGLEGTYRGRGRGRGFEGGLLRQKGMRHKKAIPRVWPLYRGCKGDREARRHAGNSGNRTGDTAVQVLGRDVYTCAENGETGRGTQGQGGTGG